MDRPRDHLTKYARVHHDELADRVLDLMAQHPAWHLPLGYKDGVFDAERVGTSSAPALRWSERASLSLAFAARTPMTAQTTVDPGMVARGNDPQYEENAS